MRKALLHMLLPAALAAGSCTVDVPAGTDTPAAILFQRPAVQAQTRSDPGLPNAQMPVEYDIRERFSVFALAADDVFANLTAAQKSRYFIDDEECAYNAAYNAWEPLTPYFWPAASALPDFRLSFQAYSPSVAAEDMTALSHDWDDGFRFTGFSPRPSGQQYDLLYSDRHLDKKRPNYTPDAGYPYDEANGDQGSRNGIDLCFHHALSALVFRIRAKIPEDAAQTIRLQKIVVRNVLDKGSFAQNVGATAAWSIDSDTSETDYTAYENTGAPDEGQRLFETANPEHDFFLAPEALMLIPQSLSHTLGGEERHVTIDVTYTRTINASGKSITITETADLVTGNEGDYYTDATSVPIDAWEMGRRYTYKLTINLFKIFVDPTVEAWNDFVPEQDLNL